VQNTRLLLIIAGAFRLLAVLSLVAGASGIGYGVSLLATSQWGVGLVILLFSLSGGGVLCLLALAAAELIPLFLSLCAHARSSAEFAEESRRRMSARETAAGLRKRLEILVGGEKDRVDRRLP
jgi:hypothetical protein